MDWHPVPFEPNLKFASGLTEDLQRKYFEQHEKAKQSLANFSRSLQNVCDEHQKLLTDNLELSLINEKLKQRINKDEPSQHKATTFLDKPSSEILGASPNCKLEKPSKTSAARKIDSKTRSEELMEQKENINELVQIFSCDFNSDMEEEAFGNHKSPPVSIVNTPEKVQCSPVLSKRKRFSSKKSNSSVSNTSSHSVTSSNDSKVSVISTPNMLEKNINEIENESSKEPEKESAKEPLRTIENTFISATINSDDKRNIRKVLDDSTTDKEHEKKPNKEPLKTIENTFIPATPNNNDKIKSYEMLGVSTTHYGRTAFTEKGKRLRQTTLSLKKVVPLIDITKVDSQETLHKKSDTKLNISMKDDELIETSPAHSEKSKLRNKLNLSKKNELARIQVKSPSVINSETASNLKQIAAKKDHSKPAKKKSTSTIRESNQNDQHSIENNNIPKSSSSKKNKNKNCSNAASEKRKSFEPQRSLSDDTYFSQAELATNKNDIADYEVDITDFEEDIKCGTPPAKKMLLDSFDMIPGRHEKSLDYAYKEGPVRNKNERAQLEGWCCKDCEKWYGHLPYEERKKRQNECSRHRGKHKVHVSTPESFWNPVFDNTYSSSDDY